MSLTWGNVQWMTVGPLVVRVGWALCVLLAGATGGTAVGSIGVKSSVEAGPVSGLREAEDAMGLFSHFRDPTEQWVQARKINPSLAYPEIPRCR